MTTVLQHGSALCYKMPISTWLVKIIEFLRINWQLSFWWTLLDCLLWLPWNINSRRQRRNNLRFYKEEQCRTISLCNSFSLLFVELLPEMASLLSDINTDSSNSHSCSASHPFLLTTRKSTDSFGRE